MNGFFFMKKISKDKIIIIPGLGNDTKYYSIITSFWKYIGYDVSIISVDWVNSNLTLSNEIHKIKSLRDKLINESINSSRITLIGVSAGGSLALNTYFSYPNDFHKVVNICGRLKRGQDTNFQLRAKTSKLFRESGLSCENKLKDIENCQKEKILSISAKFGDELVPKECSKVDNVQNIEIFSIEHLMSIFLSLTFYSAEIFKFINKV